MTNPLSKVFETDQLEHWIADRPDLGADYIQELRAELATEQEKHCACVIDDPRNEKPSSECQYHQELRERAERVEAAYTVKDAILSNIYQGVLLRNSLPVKWDVIEKQLEQALSIDAGDPGCIASLHQMARVIEAECDEWLREEGQSFASPEAWWATKAYMKARGFNWPEDTEDSHD